MGLIYNRLIENEKRKFLRNNMTKAETFLWTELRGRKILGLKFRRQFSMGTYVVGFYSPEIKLVIEVDGVTHLTKDEIEYDKNRQSEI